LLQKLFERLTGPNGTVQISSQVILLSLALLATLLVQRLGIIVRDASSTILRQQAWVTISKRVMQKLPSVPYSLFEDNSFQAHYGLVIREASYRSITLVDTLLSTGPILLGLVGLAITLFVIAPLMVVVLLVIAIPAALIERRFSDAMYDLQEGTAPARLRLEAITNMQVDSLWQRDVRVYRTDLLTREHAFLAESYLHSAQATDGALPWLARRGCQRASDWVRIGARRSGRTHQSGPTHISKSGCTRSRDCFLVWNDRCLHLSPAVTVGVAQLCSDLV
jgi:ABC-type multidrug transport system fused ATPase/permease subunit